MAGGAGDYPKIWRSVGVALHLAALLAALAVPLFAFAKAIAGVLAAPESLAAAVNLPRWGILLRNTAIVSGLAAGLSLGLGAPLALLVARTDLPGRGILAALLLLAASVPLYASAILFLAMVPLAHVQQSAVAAGIMYGLALTPLVALLLAATFASADRELEEQTLLNAGTWRTLWRSTLPQARWGLALTAVLVLLLSATDFTIPAALVVNTFAEEVYTQFQLGAPSVGPTLTALPPLAVLAVALVFVQVRYRVVGEQSPWSLASRPPRFPLGIWRRPTGVACGMAVVAIAAVGIGAAAGKIESGRQFLTAASNLRPELLNSAWMAAGGATVIVLPSIGLAWLLARGGRLRWVVATGVVWLLAVPAPIVGISLIELLNRPGPAGWLYDRPLVVVVGYYVRFLPVGIILLVPAMRRISGELVQAVQVDGGGWRRLQRHVVWPSVAADVSLAWVVAAILCFAEVGATTLIVPPGWPTASVRAFTLIHYGVYHDLAVLALLSSAVILLPWAALVWLLWRRVGRPRSP